MDHYKEDLIKMGKLVINWSAEKFPSPTFDPDKMTDQDFEEVGRQFMERARAIFKAIGVEHDFCVQAVGEVMVFGSWNRLIYSLKRGFYPAKGYCTDKFLKGFEKLDKNKI